MADEEKPKGKKAPVLRLDEIEDEGEHAVRQRALELFVRSMGMGGAIDWPALRRGGPAVYHAFLALMSRQAATGATSDTRANKAAGKANSPGTAKSKTKVSAKPALPRVERNWRNHRTPAIDFRWQAFGTGAFVTTTVCLVTFGVIWWFKL